MKAPVLVVFLLTSALFAGCIQPPDSEAPQTSDEPEPVMDPPVYILEFEIIDRTPEDGSKRAVTGAHCHSVEWHGSLLMPILYPNEQVSDGPWLTVFPEAPYAWDTSDDEDYKTTFPKTIEVTVDRTTVPISKLDHDPEVGNKSLWIDGLLETLPHQWEVTSPDGRWMVQASVDLWEGRVAFHQAGGGCD